MQGVTEGKMVHVVLENGEHRPAVIVKVWSEETGCSNLQMFTDSPPEANLNDCLPQVKWLTSFVYSEEPILNTWHWMEK